MKKIKLTRLIENTLFGLLAFIVFFLIFEERIAVPVWLQPLGRMHPMLLHFPIVILMLAVLMEFFRFQSKYKDQEFYQRFTTDLLLYGTFFSAVTIVMGLFLSKEGGYSGEVLSWHKWTGVSIVFIAAIIYWIRGKAWYGSPVARIGAVVTALCLILTGHFGATLTHGENFIMAPITAARKERVPMDQAVVFDHVILPIFEEKCVSCHSPSKLKGGLILTDSLSIRKGGDTGPLFVVGDPETSLLMERIHLPLDDEEHMPPSGKEQLTPEEIKLLSLWIKREASFGEKVIALAPDDSLRILASALLEPIAGEEHFDFEAADEKTIQNLNSDYRNVAPIALGSPALEVNVYNGEVFTAQTLEDLLQVKSQIVFLNLNDLPVKDENLKLVGEFENLRTLHLNFTDITGEGLQALATLKQLKSLSLSGTSLTFVDLNRYIPMFQSLNKLAIWDSGLNGSEVRRLQAAHPHIQIVAGLSGDHDLAEDAGDEVKEL